MENHKSFIKGALCGALVTLLIAAVLLAPRLMGGKVVTADTEYKLEMIRHLIEKEYLYEDEIDETQLQELLMKGYVAGLGDPYSVYYTEEETKKLTEMTTGEFVGIGAVLSQDKETGQVTLRELYEDSPAEKAGLLEGDIFYKVDGEDVTGLDLDTIVSKIRGEKGTTVEIIVLRGENREEYSCTAKRDTVVSKTVAYEMKENQIGYIYVSGFEQVTGSQFEEALNHLNAQGMQAVIIDLRENPGGNLSTVCDMLDLILPEGRIVSTKDKNGKEEVIYSDEERKLSLPMAVLINGNSASASEIFAGAVKDYGIGTLVGTKTYGKGIVQNVFRLNDGTSLKLTVSEYCTPNGNHIHGIGVEPDIVVEYEYDETNPERDNQLEAAMEALQK